MLGFKLVLFKTGQGSKDWKIEDIILHASIPVYTGIHGIHEIHGLNIIFSIGERKEGKGGDIGLGTDIVKKEIQESHLASGSTVWPSTIGIN